MIRPGALAAGLALAALPAAAQDVAAGRRAAIQVCQGCHGADGIARTPETPHLAGMDAQYLLAQLRAYRTGRREHEQMRVVAEMLSEQQMADLAAYFAAIEIEVVRVPGQR